MNICGKKILVKFWNQGVDTFLLLKDLFYFYKDKIYCLFYKAPSILSINESISYVINKHVSVARFGDGEIKLIVGEDLPFQKCEQQLQRLLIETISSDLSNLLVCLPGTLVDMSLYNKQSFIHWRKHLAYYRKYWYRYKKDKIYGNTQMTRCYIDLKDKSLCHLFFDNLKKIWADRDVIIVEGEQTRLGVGDDLFQNVRSIKRILAPNKNAFQFYDNILKTVVEYSCEYLILLALGPTATILAYDLAKKGYQAIDIGHVDIEYEWFLMGATTKVPVPNKFVNEAGAGKGVGDIIDVEYQSQIVCRF